MKKIAAGILTLLLLTFSAGAQEFDLNQPVLFDEFDTLYLHDINMRLDNLAVEISRIPNSKAMVKIYGSERRYSYFRGSWIKSFWTANRGIAPEKLLLQICNVGIEPRQIRLFIVRKTERVEVCKEDLSAPATTTHFDSVGFGVPDFRLVPMEDTPVYFDSQAQGEYSRYAQDALKRLLSAAPRSRVYLVGYLQTNLWINSEGKLVSRNERRDKKALAVKMLQSAKENLIKNGFSPSQIETIDGGYINDSRKVEYWFVPAGGAIPKPSPDYVPKKRK